MPRFADHLYRDGPTNPFPGLKALERRLGREIPYRLGSNEGLDMPHQALGARFGRELADLARCYGDAEAMGVRSRLSERLGTPLEALLVDAGADSLMALALRAVATPGTTVVSSAGTYPTFGYFAAGQGCRIVEVDYRDSPGILAPDLDALAQAAHREDARLVYLANPDNPGGHLHDDEAVTRLLKALPEDCHLLLDEAYHDFRADADSPSAGEAWSGAIRLRTFSKAHGLAGLRIGYAIAEPETIEMLHKVRIHYAVSSLAEAAAETLLDHSGETRAHVQAVIDRRQRLTHWLRGLGADVPDSATNFVAVRLSDTELAKRVHGELLEAGSLIHRPPHPALGHVLRISAVEDALRPGRLAALERAVSGRLEG
ncbi:histidinol-phosphate aminotransferase [Litchfieldella qijiaojingensis]|uniref:histidinol-phosphate transaminase n=1 Tax=Litchfieldella qijiaojingensis TaxID=980347 RepID=A0ABQ2YID3_9GAMM|nr:aminotransferase class I/II-fold pyridoxal phosphate-dependent enzyme [Halomonas qijiaojingensis]GGX84661.1 histidinol-phosphate aminotransferase [Halomonas qijiaojingensis]